MPASKVASKAGRSVKIGFIGAGNMAQALIKGLIESGTVKPERIFISSRSNERLEKVVQKYGVQACSSNEKLVESVDFVVLSMKPQDLIAAVEPLSIMFDEDQVVISLAAGFGIERLSQVIKSTKKIVRIMPNTPIRIRKAVVGLAMSEEAELNDSELFALFRPLGEVVHLDDGEQFQALTVAAASGTGFIFELMQYWQEWIEGYGVDSIEARRIVTQTFLGAAQLAEIQAQMSFDDLLSQVTSKKGVTYAGLESMRENEIERMLRISFEKAMLRDSELAKGN